MAKEKDLENKVKQFLKDNGCWYVKYWGGGGYTRSGVPDLLICCTGIFMAVELKAPKGRNNRFGGYYYRSTEDILTALKPLLKKHKVILTISDGLELIGDRYYVKATACLEDVEAETGISVSAYARETLERKKSDDSQLTGAASSYARKYALNGLFLIDDTHDPDTYEDDPEELDRQEEEELEEKPARKPRGKKAEPAPDPEDVADHDRYLVWRSPKTSTTLPAMPLPPAEGMAGRRGAQSRPLRKPTS